MRFSACLMVLRMTVALAQSVNVVNNCGEPIYFKSVHSGGAGDDQLYEVAPGASQEVAMDADGAGTSVKIGKDPGLAEVSQFEYTVAADGIYWDVSNIDGSPFNADGISAGPAGGGSGQGGCAPVSCSSADCPGVYQAPDDPDTRFCARQAGGYEVNTCGGAGGGGGGGAGGSGDGGAGGAAGGAGGAAGGAGGAAGGAGGAGDAGGGGAGAGGESDGAGGAGGAGAGAGGEGGDAKRSRRRFVA